MEALDADAVRAALPCLPISGGAAADRIAEAFGTPNVIGEKANVTSSSSVGSSTVDCSPS